MSSNKTRTPRVEAHIIRLTTKEQERFASLLLDPPKLSPAMARAAKAHTKLIASTP